MRLSDVRIGSPAEIADAQWLAANIAETIEGPWERQARDVLTGVILYVRHTAAINMTLEEVRIRVAPPNPAEWRTHFEAMLDSLATPISATPAVQNVIGKVASDTLNAPPAEQAGLREAIANALDRYERLYPELF
jgi:hypothetical protein